MSFIFMVVALSDVICLFSFAGDTFPGNAAGTGSPPESDEETVNPA